MFSKNREKLGDQKGANTSEAGGSRGRSYEPKQMFFLLRLDCLLRQRDEWISLLLPDDWRTRLLKKAIFSTFIDCLEQRVGEDARTILPGKETVSQKPSQEPK